jgi:ABC-type multidrug transport system ATPase subunit
VTSASADSAPVVTSGLTKRFRRQIAVDRIDLEVPDGAVYGFLGPNGSGKTTTIRMLLRLISPTAGEISLLGVPMPAAARNALRRVGSLVEGPAFHPYLSGRANLARLDAADRYSDPRTSPSRIESALDRVGLLAAAQKRYRAYSLGMRQRLAIAASLLMPRELLVLDEPTNGLDPQGTREVRHLITDLAGDGATVLVSSHLLAEVEQTCSHVVVMHRGEVVATGEVAELVAGGQMAITVPPGERDRAVALVAAGEHAAEADRDRDDVVVVDLGRDAGPLERAAVVRRVVDAGIDVVGVGPRRRLEDVFLALIGEEGPS